MEVTFKIEVKLCGNSLWKLVVTSSKDEYMPPTWDHTFAICGLLKISKEDFEKIVVASNGIILDRQVDKYFFISKEDGCNALNALLVYTTLKEA